MGEVDQMAETVYLVMAGIQEGPHSRDSCPQLGHGALSTLRSHHTEEDAPHEQNHGATVVLR